MLDHRERRILCQSSFLVSPINEERTKEQWDSFLSLYRKERIPLVLLPVPAKEFCMAQRGLRPEFLCCLRLLVSGRSAVACLPDFLFMALSELSIVLFEARYRFWGSLASIGSRATYFFMMERIRTLLYFIGSLASSSSLGALRDAASLT